MSTPQQRLDRADDLFQLLTRLPGSEFGAAPECAETDAEVFMPGQGADVVLIRQAKEICSRCPIKEACLEFALKNHEPGIWGGTSEVERRRMRAAAAAGERREAA